MNVDRTEIKFQLHEGREKRTLLERYLNHEPEASHRQDFINPYTGESMGKKLMGSMREHNPPMNKEKMKSMIFDKDAEYDSQEDITNLSELIKMKKVEKQIREET